MTEILDQPRAGGARASSDAAADSQRDVSDEMAAITRLYVDAGREETQPRLDYAPYHSSLLRHPTKASSTPTRMASSCGRRSSASATSWRSRPT